MVGSVIDLCSEKFCIASCSFSFEREISFYLWISKFLIAS